jgi:hypothetical protein
MITRISARNWTHLFTLYPTNGAFSKNAIHCPESRKQSVRNAWAIISGRTNWMLAIYQARTIADVRFERVRRQQLTLGGGGGKRRRRLT